MDQKKVFNQTYQHSSSTNDVDVLVVNQIENNHDDGWLIPS